MFSIWRISTLMASFPFSGSIGHNGGKLILTEDMVEGQDQQLTPAINQTCHLSITKTTNQSLGKLSWPYKYKAHTEIKNKRYDCTENLE